MYCTGGICLLSIVKATITGKYSQKIAFSLDRFDTVRQSTVSISSRSTLHTSTTMHVYQYLLALFAGYCTIAVASTELPSAKVEFRTTAGNLIINVYKTWAPIGAERFLELVHDGFYTDIAFFRCVEGFLTQFGLTDNPEKKHWHYEEIEDDPNLHMGIQKNYLSFAGGGPNTRSTQLFIAFEYLDFLGNEPWETPFGVVSAEGQQVLDSLYKGYGEMTPFNENGIDQQKIQNYGNSYVRDNFPETSFLISARIIEVEGVPVPASQQSEL